MSVTHMRAICVAAVQLVIAGFIATLAQSASAQETAKGLLAIQVRSQGYVCNSPVSGKKKG
jgi:hypothetical protein